MSAFTKGPWRLDSRSQGINAGVERMQYSVIAATHETVVHMVAGGRAHSEANAKLIVCSPEMAEMLLAIHEQKLGWKGHTRADLEALLKKAGVL